MENSRLYIRDGVNRQGLGVRGYGPGKTSCDRSTLVGHEPVITLVTTTHPVCKDCAKKLAPRLCAVVALWKGNSAEQRWPNPPPKSAKADNE
jgi:hypothetical protein